jgi:4-hydroxy-2-oxovalerate/4-hydroxy-2-oxohexanoate aldolase
MNMELRGKKITVHDMTLRDGMHPKRHLMTLDQMKSIATGLDAAGVPLIEVTHGDGLGGSSVNYGFPAHSDEEYLGAVIPLMKQAKVSALLLPGIGTVDHLKMAHGLGVTPSASPPTAPRPTCPSSTSPWHASWAWTPSAS